MLADLARDSDAALAPVARESRVDQRLHRQGGRDRRRDGRARRRARGRTSRSSPRFLDAADADDAQTRASSPPPARRSCATCARRRRRSTRSSSSSGRSAQAALPTFRTLGDLADTGSRGAAGGRADHQRHPRVRATTAKPLARTLARGLDEPAGTARDRAPARRDPVHDGHVERVRRRSATTCGRTSWCRASCIVYTTRQTDPSLRGDASTSSATRAAPPRRRSTPPADALAARAAADATAAERRAAHGERRDGRRACGGRRRGRVAGRPAATDAPAGSGLLGYLLGSGSGR